MSTRRHGSRSPALSISELVNPATADKRLLLGTLVSRFTTSYLRRAYQIFDGDLVLALVFGEIAQYNVSRALRPLISQGAKAPQKWKQLVRTFELEKVAPCNALSISEATGIPRETVRRKVKELQRRNWLSREDPTRLTVSPEVSGELQDFTIEILQDFIATAQLISELPELKLRAATDSASR